MIIYTSVSRERKAQLMINHVISRVMTHRDMNTLEDIFVGYEIWGYLSVIPIFSFPISYFRIQCHILTLLKIPKFRSL